MNITRQKIENPANERSYYSDIPRHVVIDHQFTTRREDARLPYRVASNHQLRGRLCDPHVDWHRHTLRQCTIRCRVRLISRFSDPPSSAVSVLRANGRGRSRRRLTPSAGQQALGRPLDWAAEHGAHLLPQVLAADNHRAATRRGAQTPRVRPGDHRCLLVPAPARVRA